jgi:hypothetical protein
MQFPANNQKGRCAFCGKPVPVKDIRDRRAAYCNRVHASMAKYGQRYTGGGPQDVPDLNKKTEQL